MAQLVGQMCVVCKARIGSDLDGRFCSLCGCPVHAVCVPTDASRKIEGACLACGAPPAEIAPRREAAQQQAAWQAGAPQRRRGGWMMAASAGFMLLGLVQFALAGMRPPANDRHEQRGNVLNALIPVGLGFAGFLLGLRQLSKRS
jgi:hypothetical protein